MRPAISREALSSLANAGIWRPSLTRKLLLTARVAPKTSTLPLVTVTLPWPENDAVEPLLNFFVAMVTLDLRSNILYCRHQF